MGGLDRHTFLSPSTFSIPTMTPPSYPGKGLSLSQLAFALNEELKRSAYSPLYVADDVPGLALAGHKERCSDLLTDSPLRIFPKSTRMSQQRWQTSASGGTPSSPSTASLWTSFPSSLPVFLPRRTDSGPLPCAVIGVGPSFNVVHCGHNYTSRAAWNTRKLSSSAPKGPS